jgi:hypothetical protein
MVHRKENEQVNGGKKEGNIPLKFNSNNVWNPGRSYKTVNDDDQWRYSPDRALASLYGFHDSFIVRLGLSAPRSTYSRHPDSAIRNI